MPHATETAILLHGIGRTRLSMRPLERALAAAGYGTENLTYPSRRLSIPAIADWLAPRLLELWRRSTRVHLVTHSMGGLVAAQYLAGHGDREKTGRVVMLAPPLMGSEVADALHHLPPYHWLFGPAGQELMTSARIDPMRPYYEFGIIAGTSGGLYPLGRAFIRGLHDGRVAVERTKHPGMADHLVVAASHSFIMRKPEVQRQIQHFLEEGHFAR
jgi:pimeloyl-ACP methyl ester carboxylesterase